MSRRQPCSELEAGEKAKEHEVYFGDDAAAVAAADTTSPLFKGRQADTTFRRRRTLEWGKTYYWRVDEIEPGGAREPVGGQRLEFHHGRFHGRR